jgi:hypothetical protein
MEGLELYIFGGKKDEKQENDKMDYYRYSNPKFWRKYGSCRAIDTI